MHFAVRGNSSFYFSAPCYYLDQINISGCRGNATGRNIHQKPLDEAVRLANAISAITIDGKSVEEAVKVRITGSGTTSEATFRVRDTP